MRQDFTDQELRDLVSGELFQWHWMLANGCSDGMLLGFRESQLEVGAIDKGEFFISASLFHRPTEFKWEFIGVYVPADHGRSAAFLSELEAKFISCRYPVLVGEILI
jgi:hypothetical protein